MSIKMASSLCGYQQIFEETQEIQAQPIQTYPENAAVIDGCEQVIWTKCEGEVDADDKYGKQIFNT